MSIVDIKLIAHITFKVYDKSLQTDTSAFLWLTDQQKRRLFTIKLSPASVYWLYLSTASVNVTLFNLIWDKVTCKNLTLQKHWEFKPVVLFLFVSLHTFRRCLLTHLVNVFFWTASLSSEIKQTTKLSNM